MRYINAVIGLVIVILTIFLAWELLYRQRLVSLIASSNGYQYGYSNPSSTAIDADSNLLYVSFFGSDKVLEIEPSTMQLLREFSIAKPGVILAPTESPYIYVESTSWPGYVNRINTDTGAVSSLEMSWPAIDMCFGSGLDVLWVIGETWPAENEGYNYLDAYNHPGTGRLTKINLNSFQVIQTHEINPLPMSVIHSEYTQNLYIWHELETIDDESAQIVGHRIYETDTETGTQDKYFIAGPDSGYEGVPRMEFWSDDQRYLAVPNPRIYEPPQAITIMDLESWQDVTDQIFPEVGNVPFGVRHIRRSQHQHVLWCTGWGTIEPGNTDEPLLMINGDTGEFEVYGVSGPDLWGDFSISPETCFLYLVSPRTDEIFKFEPPNHEPSCHLEIVTAMPYQGPSPAEIEFDATSSYDPDPCDELTFEWDFDGDHIYGEPVDDAYTGPPDNPTHSYTEDYIGIVNLKLTDNHGAESYCLVTVEVDII